MKNAIPFPIIAGLLVLAITFCSFRSDKAEARRNLRHQQNHYYVRSRIHVDKPAFLQALQVPYTQQLEWNSFFFAVGAIGHNRR